MQWVRFDAALDRLRADAERPSGPVVRGLFGARLASRSPDRCAPGRPECAPEACLYHRLFETRAGPPAYRVLVSGTRGEPLRLTVVVIGEHGPTVHESILAAIREALAKLGWRLRTPSGGRRRRLPTLDTSAESGRDVWIELQTPTRLKRHRRVLADPEELDFPLFAKFLLHRIDHLDRCHGSGAGVERPAALERGARAVETLDRKIRFEHACRFSRRQTRRIPLDGWTGTIGWRGVPESLLPVLQAGEDLGLGSGCAYGLGAYRIRAVRPCERAEPGRAC